MSIYAGLDLSIALFIMICEAILFGFLFCIGRFYEIKFHDRTYYQAFLLPILVALISIIFFPVSGMPLEYVALVSNLSALAVLLTFGTFLYVRMTGVTR